ncbi:hypothetical protein [Curtobacterium sp. MCJR17_020]|uniref:hypothetical protein n=1 Tax=Curtobacterium sp. MCJR17_020 TaxID=2175619 RepID=UPI0011B706FA|nr:hypothetical protein [Curtobacterium sp. MCJR17_020]WIE71851.1 hypothetical protein DEJ14_016985 [Curtobacterium sp. MCJR17_020]
MHTSGDEVTVDIGDVVDADQTWRGACRPVRRIRGAGLLLGGAVLVGGVVVADRPSDRGTAAALVGTVLVAAGLVVLGYLVTRRRLRLARAARTTAMDAGVARVLTQARAAGVPELDPASVRRVLVETDNGPGPWYDPKLGPDTWPVWRMLTADPTARVFVVGRKSDNARTLTITVQSAKPSWWQQD